MNELFRVTILTSIACLSLQLFISSFKETTDDIINFSFCLDRIEMYVLESKIIFMSQGIVVTSIIFSFIIELLEIDYYSYSLKDYLLLAGFFTVLFRYRGNKLLKLKKAIIDREISINKNSEGVKFVQKRIESRKGSLSNFDYQKIVDKMSRKEIIDCLIHLSCFKYRIRNKNYDWNLVALENSFSNKVFDNAISTLINR